MPKVAPQPVTKILLNIISHVADSAIEMGELCSALVTGYGSAYRRGGSGYVAELKRMRRAADLRRKVRELARRRYVRIQRIGDRLMVSLTDKGYRATILNRFKQSGPHPQKWYTVVSFDIPEKASNSRKQLRLLLKQAGFKRLQQSIWVSRADTLAVVAEFVRQVKAQHWVNVYYAKNFLWTP